MKLSRPLLFSNASVVFPVSFNLTAVSQTNRNTVHASKNYIQLHKMWGKVELKRNNGGIDELKRRPM